MSYEMLFDALQFRRNEVYKEQRLMRDAANRAFSLRDEIVSIARENGYNIDADAFLSGESLENSLLNPGIPNR